jgi:FkbM family methyltransferase
MPNYYGQRGDDFLLWLPFLEQKTSGYFVEVGALDGKRFSNTYSFEEQGWTGICIEAHPDYIDIIKKNRPNSKVVFAAAGDENTTVTFYTNNRGSLSTLDPSQEEQFKAYGAYFTGFVEREVPMMTLTRILDDAQAPTIIDILSIDVEGGEMRVLAGMDWNKYTASVIIIEVSTTMESDLVTYFEALNYHLARNYHGNLILCREKTDAQLIASTEVNCVTTHTPHILDEIQASRGIQITNSQVILYSQKPKTLFSKFITRLRNLFTDSDPLSNKSSQH